MTAGKQNRLIRLESAESQPIRVLHVVTTMNRGGLETMLMNYYRYINRNKIQFDFLIHRQEESDYEEEILNLGGRIYRIQPMRPFSRSYKAALNQFFNQHPEYLIIHVHQDCMSSISLSEAKRCHIPVRISHCHNSNQDKNWKYPIKLLFKRSISKKATHLLSCSKKSGVWMFGTDNFQILNNAIDTEKFKYSSNKRSKIREEFNIPENYVLLGHVGRFDKAKNHEHLIRVFSDYLKINEQAILLLVGVGAEFEEIKRIVNELQLQDKVIFTGLRTDIPALMSAMDFFIMPSFYEGTPMVLVEAQTSGLPCLISDSIPDDCDLTSSVVRCSLNKKTEEWAEVLKNIQLNERSIAYTQIRERGFDVQKNIAWLTEFYLNSLQSVCQLNQED